MRSGSGGGAGGGGRSKGGKSGTGTVATVAGTLGAAAAPAASAAAAPAAAAAQAAPAAASAAAAPQSALAQLKQASDEYQALKKPTREQRDAYDDIAERLSAKAYDESKAAFQASAPAGGEARVLAALDAVSKHETSIREGAADGLRTVRTVRDFAGMSKADFDNAALALASKEKVGLHYHDYPASLSAAQRADMIQDKAGTYYLGIARRRDE